MKYFKKLLEKFRYNMDKYFDFWSKKNDKSKCDLVVFVTKDDIFTPNYKKADKIWGEYVDKVEETVVIDGNNHYFLVESSDLIADVIINKFVKEE